MHQQKMSRRFELEESLESFACGIHHHSKSILICGYSQRLWNAVSIQFTPINALQEIDNNRHEELVEGSVVGD